MNPRDIQLLLTFLGHYSGPLDGKLPLDAVKNFQAHEGLYVDGIVGPKTTAKMQEMQGLLKNAPDAMTRLAPWRITSYHVAEARMGGIPVLDVHGKTLARVTSDSFAEAALEGTVRVGGKLLNVDQYVTALCPTDYEAVAGWYLAYKKGQTDQGRAPKPPEYFGISLDSARVTRVMAFKEVTPGVGYGTEKLDLPKIPYLTLAADLIPKPTKWAKHEGLIVPGTKVFLLEMVGKPYPGGMHDGWFTVNDCGGGIYGAHFDLFVGTKELGRKYGVVERSHVWWPGMEKVVSVGYDHGLW